MATNLHNIVKKDKLREAQLNTLQKIAQVVGETAGPYGSYTMILNEGQSNVFTKDGHKVLSNIKFFHPLESSIIDEINSSTGYIVKTVGDGTTAMTKMSYYVFKELCAYEESHPEVPRHKIISALKTAIEDVQSFIEDSGRELTLEDIYKICMISTDGNESVSNVIAEIYKDHGLDVFIDLGISTTEDHVLRSYDGMTIQRGYTSPCYINTSKGTCEIEHPRIYCFTDPVDTPEMINLFGRIVYENIMKPLDKTGQSSSCIPTVIMCPSITRDYGDNMAQIEAMMYQFKDITRKPPLLVICGFSLDLDFYQDLIMLSGAKMIKKFIDPKIQEQAIEEGTAPSVENVSEFYGTCDKIVTDNSSTCFINPAHMYEKDENGETILSKEYNSLIEFLQGELQHSIDNSQDITTINTIKRRLHSLQSNYVEYLIGGISSADRTAIKDLAEDAILNLRSAALNGVGRGANFEGFSASAKLTVMDVVNGEEDEIIRDMHKILYKSFKENLLSLYRSAFGDGADDEIELSVVKDQPVNLRTREYNDDVLCSIETDIAILEAIDKIVTMMFNTTQSLLALPTQNIYLSDEEIKKE